MAQNDLTEDHEERVHQAVGAEQQRMFGLSAPTKGTDERYTNAEILGLVGLVWPEGIGCDPAWSAGSLVKADVTYTKEQDGKHADWRDRTWLNPPFSDPSFWVRRLAQICIANNWEGMMITRCDPASSWFDWHWTARRVCFPRERTRFIKPGEGIMGTPEFCVAISYFGKRVREFKRHFSRLGHVVTP